MNRQLLALFFASFGICASTVQAQTANDLASEVNPMIGTKASLAHSQDNGNTLPGATRPFGMLYWSPDSDSSAFYRYENPAVRGFSLTHVSGAGCGQLGDAPMMVVNGKLQVLPFVRSSGFGSQSLVTSAYRHEDEVAEPGYYRVKLDSGIEIELAAALRSGLAEISLPADGDVHTLFIDLSHNLTSVYDAEMTVRDGYMTGSVSSGGGGCGSNEYHRTYFSYQVEEKPDGEGTFSEAGFGTGAGSVKGPRTGAYMVFGPGTRTVHVKVGISYVSVANAAQNAVREIPSWDFARLRQEARADWNENLSRVEVRGGSAHDRRAFYTELYHALRYPSVFNDVNGEYIGFDEKIHRVQPGRTHYTLISGWDIYRSEAQLLAVLFPKRASDIAQSLVLDAEQGGGLPIWPLANDDQVAMGGDPSDPIIASFYALGARDFDVRAAFAAMLRGADDPKTRSRSYLERPRLEELLRLGYLPDSKSMWGSASVTLEDQAADFAIAQMAAELGDKATAERMLARAANWKKLFDPETKYIRPRMPDGSFMQPFSDSSIKGFMEGNSAQYTWMVPFDLKGVIDAIGGSEAANRRLDNYFSSYSTAKSMTANFYIGNEPCFGNPWIYNWTGQPWRAQEMVRKTLRDLFFDGPDGLPGNDDLGATSSWALFAQLGLFPEIPGVGGFALSSPAFESVTLKLDDRKFEILASGAPQKIYIESVTLDGKPVSNWIWWNQMAKSSKLEFKLSSVPIKDRGEQPPSYPAK
jgi:predicted alpha-1,2-mannosidase